MNVLKFFRPLLLAVAAFFSLTSQAQIGYQVALLNNATGEPRFNETVQVTVKITDSTGAVICEEIKSETSNDFGVISMSVGNSETFSNANWNNLPFFIEASVDNHLLGRSQILSVPVAEYAKNTGSLTREKLCSKTWSRYGNSFKFNMDGSASVMGHSAKYILDGNTVIIHCYGGDATNKDYLLFYSPIIDVLLGDYTGVGAIK